MIRIAGRTYEVDWGHLLVATLIVGTCLWYLADARSTSRNIQNLLLVQPATVLAVILYLLVLPQCVRRVTDEAEESPSQAALTAADLLRVAALAAAFGFFIFSLEILGFDVGAWLFVTAGLFICGERRPLVLAIFPLVFTVAVVLGYQQLLPYPIHTLIL